MNIDIRSFNKSLNLNTECVRNLQSLALKKIDKCSQSSKQPDKRVNVTGKGRTEEGKKQMGK